MSISPVVTLGYGSNAGAAIAFVVTEGYSPSFVAPPPATPTGGMVKRRNRYEIEIDGQKLTAASIPALEAMVVRWRARKTANDNPRPQARVPQPEPPKEVVPDRPALEAGNSGDTATPPAELEAPGAVVPLQFGPTQSEFETAQQSLAAQAVLADLAKIEAEALKRRQREDDDDIDAIMAILEAIA